MRQSVAGAVLHNAQVLKRRGATYVVVGSVLIAVAAGVYVVGLDTADQVASVIGALFGAMALSVTLSELQHRRSERSAGTAPSAKPLDPAKPADPAELSDPANCSQPPESQHPAADEPPDPEPLARAGRLSTRTLTLLAVSVSLVVVGVVAIPLLDASRSDQSSGKSPTCASSSTGAVALVVGARANVPRPTLLPEARSLVRAGLAAGETVHVIRLDGRPVPASSVRIEPRGNRQARDRQVAEALNDLTVSLSNLRAVVPQADVLTGLSVGARAVGDRGTVVLMDSGLQTVTPLNFREPGVVEADPGEVSNFLRSKTLLPPLSDRAVVLVGVGDVAPPQQPLNERQRINVVGIWRQLALSAGARCVQSLETPVIGDAPAGAPPVGAVTLPVEQSFALACGTQYTLTTQTISFVPDTARFRDPVEAEATLGTLAERLRTGNFTVELVGSAESIGNPASKVALSQARAEAVRYALTRLGVPAGHITSRGENGSANAAAPGNRLVTVLVKC